MTDTDRPAGKVDPSPDVSALKDAITKQGDVIKALKAEKAPKEKIQPEVDRLLALKEEFKRLSLKETEEKHKNRFDRSQLESMLLKRFFYAPSFEIYGGMCGIQHTRRLESDLSEGAG